MSFWGCSIPNALNLEKKIGVNIRNCALLLDFLALFCHNALIPLFFRISPVNMMYRPGRADSILDLDLKKLQKLKRTKVAITSAIN